MGFPPAGGGGGSPTGAAGGDLTGSTYPNPVVAASKITTAKLASAVTLDAIATAHATGADVAMNGHKITGLTNGSSAQDAAAFGQLPAAARIQTGAGSPLGSVTPTSIGYLYIDTTNGGAWIAEGATNTDWISVGGATNPADLGISSSVASGVSVRATAVGTSVSLSGSQGNPTVQIGDDGAFSDTLGFFGASPVPQPVLTALSTPADIVAALQSLGLSA